MTRKLLTLMLALGLPGCAASISPYALASAGRIGCPAEHIALSHLQNDERAPQAWVARCGHVQYACSSNGDPRRPNTRIVCSELGHPHALSWAR